MGKRLAIVLCLIALPLQAQPVSLRGQWEIRIPSQPAYTGAALVDAEGRVTWDAPNDHGRPAKFIGYVARITGPKVDLTFTDRVNVAHFRCSIQASDLLHCWRLLDDGTISVVATLTRVGPGPAKLMSALPRSN